MALRPVMVNIKALDHSAVGRFWAEALGWSAHSPGVPPGVAPAGGLARPDPVAVGIEVVPVPEAKTTKNRVHLDLATTSATAEARTLRAVHHARVQGPATSATK